ncbi:MAG: nitroreductase [Pseudomonadota bacterium]
MGDLAEHLATRRTVAVKWIIGPGPDSEALYGMMTMAARVPDHGKLAPWRFIVFEGDARATAGDALAAIAERKGLAADAEAKAAERERLMRAPVVVAVISTARDHPKIPVWEQQLSAGAVCLNFLHAANAHGYAAQWLTEWIAFDDEAKAALGVRDGENVAGFIYIGTPDIKPTDRDRPNMDAIITRYEA